MNEDEWMIQIGKILSDVIDRSDWSRRPADVTGVAKDLT